MVGETLNIVSVGIKFESAIQDLIGLEIGGRCHVNGFLHGLPHGFVHS